MSKKKAAVETPNEPPIERGPTKLELNGRTYLLTYDVEAIIAAEELTSTALLFGVDWKNVGTKRIRAMLYAFMVPSQPTVTLDEITKLITADNLILIENAIVKTMKSAWHRETSEKVEATAAA